MILLPSLQTQREIAKRLERADHLRRMRRYAVHICDELLPATFLQIFGDLQKNSHHFAIVELGELLAFITSGSRGWAEFYVSEGTRFIRSLDVRMNFISDEDAVFVNPPENAEAKRTRVITGDVLLTITGSRIGRVASVPPRLQGAFISQHVAILRLKTGLLPTYLSMYLSSETGGQVEIARLQYGQTKPGLNLDQLREFRLPLPPLSLQQQFATFVERDQKCRAAHLEAIRQADHLFQTLLQQAFAK